MNTFACLCLLWFPQFIATLWHHRRVWRLSNSLIYYALCSFLSTVLRLLSVCILIQIETLLSSPARFLLALSLPLSHTHTHRYTRAHPATIPSGEYYYHIWHFTRGRCHHPSLSADRMFHKHKQLINKNTTTNNNKSYTKCGSSFIVSTV